MKETEAIQHAREKFKNHVATYCDYGNISTLTWAKPGTKEHSIRFVFDREFQTVTITGDLGEAVLWPTCKCDLEHCAKAFGSINYFAEKVRTSSNMYIYDEEEAKAELCNRLLHEEVDEQEKVDRENLIDEIMRNFDRWDGVGTLDDDTSNILINVDPDAFELLGSLGRHYHLRVYLWMYALRMAYKQVKEKDQPEIHVVLGMSTAHISPKTQEYLDECVDGRVGSATFRKEDVCGNYGWWVACFEEPDEDIPDDLRECILFAQEHGADWIMFDGDATSYDDLPKYNDEDIAPGTYISIWDDGFTVHSSCKVNTSSREVVFIQMTDVDCVENLQGEFVEINGIQHEVLDHKPETEEEWAELRRKDGYWRD